MSKRLVLRGRLNAIRLESVDNDWPVGLWTLEMGVDSLVANDIQVASRVRITIEYLDDEAGDE